MASNMWKNCLKNIESDNNKVLYEILLDFFLQRNVTYFLNKPRINLVCFRSHGILHVGCPRALLLYECQMNL